MNVLSAHMTRWHLLFSGLCILGIALLVAFFGFGVAPWAILIGAFCIVMMVSMVWMMVGMGKGAMHRH